MLLRNERDLGWELRSGFLAVILAQASFVTLTPGKSSLGPSLSLSFPVHKTGIWITILSLHDQGGKFHLLPPKKPRPPLVTPSPTSSPFGVPSPTRSFLHSLAGGKKKKRRGGGRGLPYRSSYPSGHAPPVVPSAPLRPRRWDEAIT